MKKIIVYSVGLLSLLAVLFPAVSLAKGNKTVIESDICVDYGEVVFKEEVKSGQMTYRSYYRSSYFVPHNYLGDKVWDRSTLVFDTLGVLCEKDL